MGKGIEPRSAFLKKNSELSLWILRLLTSRRRCGLPAAHILIQWTFGPVATLEHAPIDMPMPQRPPSLPLLRRTSPAWTGTWCSGPVGGSRGGSIQFNESPQSS